MLEKLKKKKILVRILPFGFIFLLTAAFFWPFFLKGFLPIPADTTIGLYHPWRDAFAESYPRGLPFKNFLITDPVRQQYPWRWLAVDLLKKGQNPVWNPYTHAGQPLMANLQTAAFYPLNFLFFLLPFNSAWGILIFLQPLLAGIFTYFYLGQLKLKKTSALMGAVSFSFSGFFIAWLEWGTILQVALWLPLILLSVEKIFGLQKSWSLLNRQTLKWGGVFLTGLAFAFLAGHWQIFFYLAVFLFFYLVWKLAGVQKNRRRLIIFFLSLLFLFLAVTSFQWWPGVAFIKASAREIDQVDWQKPGWFVPWSHLVQFLAPDFFGNPTTLNYWGEWNYGEFAGYVGVVPLVLAFLSLVGAGRKKTGFFALFGLTALSFALPTPWAEIPYRLKIPFLSTSQPTRLLFLVDFCLAVLAAFGFEGLVRHLQVNKKKASLLMTLGWFGILFGLLWAFVSVSGRFWPGASWLVNLPISRRNLILPTALLVSFFGLIFGHQTVQRFFMKKKKAVLLLPFFFFLTFSLTVFDLFRFGWKFNPFVDRDWLFPSTETLEFLKNDPEIFRIMSTDRRLLPPNFSVIYKIQTLDGYDPLYLRRYGELIAALERGAPDISPPFGFNRIITPQNFESGLIDLLNVKYVLSLTDLDSPKLELVFREGETRVYRNERAFPRAFIVYDYRPARSKQEAINLLTAADLNLFRTAVLEAAPEGLILAEANSADSENSVKIREYRENEIVVEVETEQPGILILTDAYYPGWRAEVDQQKTELYRADYNFRGLVVPEGKHEVVFKL